VSALTEAELSAVAGVLTDQGVSVLGPLSAELIAGGRSNLTFRLDDGSSQWVLRMPPRSGRTPSAHDVAREHRVTSALRHTDVPVAPAVALCTDESLLGGPFAVAEFVTGRTLQSRADLDTLDDPTVSALLAQLVETLASLHAVDHVAVGLERFGRPNGYAERQIRRWSGQWSLVARNEPDLQRAATELISRLAETVPEQRATGIVHGDFRIDNTLLRLDSPPTVAAVVDWELSTIGDPVADVAMMCVYRHPAFDLIVGGASAWTSLRLPDADALAAAYEGAGGVRLESWDFHLALAYFKIAVIAAGIDHRYRSGSGSGPGFDSAGGSVVPFLEAGLQAIARADGRTGSPARLAVDAGSRGADRSTSSGSPRATDHRSRFDRPSSDDNNGAST
jgi:aminoglycoside phosphotransferase (APT) family kinase protein